MMDGVSEHLATQDRALGRLLEVVKFFSDLIREVSFQPRSLSQKRKMKYLSYAWYPMG